MARPGKPWQRNGKGPWYAKIRGEVVNLGHDEDKAFALFANLTAEQQGVADAVLRAIGAGRATGGVRAGTVAGLVPAYLTQARVAPRTRRYYVQRLTWLERNFGPVPVSDLDPAAVEAAVQHEPWANNTKRLTLTVCMIFARWCGRTDFKPHRPPTESRGDEVVVTPDEHRRLVATANGDFGPYLETLWHTGARPDEISGLTVELVNWQSGTARLKYHKTAYKGGVRILYFTPESLAVLAVQRGRYQSGYLFRSITGRRFSDKLVVRRMARCVQAAGVRDCITAYSYRHSFIHGRLLAGKSSSVVAKLVGHADSKLIDRTYGHLSSDAQWLREQAG
jgi:integrase